MKSFEELTFCCSVLILVQSVSNELKLPPRLIPDSSRNHIRRLAKMSASLLVFFWKNFKTKPVLSRCLFLKWCLIKEGFVDCVLRSVQLKESGRRTADVLLTLVYIWEKPVWSWQHIRCKTAGTVTQLFVLVCAREKNDCAFIVFKMGKSLLLL